MPISKRQQEYILKHFSTTSVMRLSKILHLRVTEVFDFITNNSNNHNDTRKQIPQRGHKISRG